MSKPHSSNGNRLLLVVTLIAVAFVGQVLARAEPPKRLGSNDPIITIPDTTTPEAGIGGETESTDPVNPNPGPPGNNPGGPDPAPMQKGGVRAMQAGGQKLFVYVVLKEKYRVGAPVAASMPGVLGKPWRAVTRKERTRFHIPLSTLASGNTYYVVGISMENGVPVYRRPIALTVKRSSSAMDK